MKSITIGPNDAGQRLDKFLQKAFPQLPQSAMYKAIRTKHIKLNRKRCEISTRLNTGDVLDIYINDELLASPKPQQLFLSAPILQPDSIVYEDENILLCDKRPGLIVHEDERERVDTLINRILHYLYQKGEFNPQAEQSFTPALCNRIDRNTGGIVIAAKNAEALRILNEKIKTRQLQKYYYCIVHGVLPQKAATLKGYLIKDEKTNTVQVFDAPRPGAKTIFTKYRVVKESPALSLLEIELLTGRTHQIRAQFAHIGHPLLGDAKYGQNRQNKGTGYKFQALYAYKLAFDFKTGAGALAYLNGRSFAVKSVWFYDEFMSGKLL